MIEKPALSESLNLLKFSWDNGISVELHRLNDSGKAEIWARYSHNDDATIIMRPIDLNILAARSVEEQCTRYKRLCPGLSDFDWNEAFDYIVPMALEVRRRGEPVIELGKPGIEIKRPEWDAYPLVVKGMPNILFGDRGSLKSKLALVLALVMMLPLNDNELGIAAPPKSLKVLKLDFEATQDADEYEWHRLLRGLDMEGAVQLQYRSCRRALADDVEAISNHADAINADVLIVDSLGPAAGGDLNASEPALKLNAALRQLNRTILMPAHTAKNQLGKRSVFGSVFYENLARNVWEVTKEESEDSESNLQHIALQQTKSPPFAPHHKPIAFEFDFDQDEERTIVRKYDPNKLEIIQTKTSLRSQIIDVLKSGAMSPKNIADEIGKPAGDIRQALFHAKKTGKVVQLGDGTYGLPFTE